MNLSFNWIDELAGLDGELKDPRALADRLTMIATAVEKVETVGAGLDGIVAAKVLEVGPHPNADRLRICQIDRGDGLVLDVVCGAPVIVQGGLYPHIAPGGTLPGGFAIESRKIRGELSHGMLCSEVELELGRDKSGIMQLSDEISPGFPVADALGFPDTRLTLDLNPNRVDLACHIGVAREVSHSSKIQERVFDGAAWSPEWKDGESRAQGAGVTVSVEVPERCSRYMAAVIRGVRVGPSPPWLTGRLMAAGSRSVNNVVDATNYVLLERNQPLHAFDLMSLRRSQVSVRAARDGEKLTTLDGEERKLVSSATVIADSDRAIALAGVMGGLDTEVTADTVDVLIECAAFDSRGVRETARVAGLSTDASYRFERGIDQHAQERALVRCVELVLTVAGGEADVEGVRVGVEPTPPIDLPLRIGRVNQVLGLGLEDADIDRALDPIGLTTIRPNGVDVEALSADGTMHIQVPGWRTDITREIDLVEEVARRIGFEEFPEKERRFRPSIVPSDPTVEKAARVRRVLVSCGLFEARSLPFMPEEYRGNRQLVAVPNPLSETESYLRAAMVPVLLRRLEHNFARGNRDVRLFEIGTVFCDQESGDANGTGMEGAWVGESQRVGVVVTGTRYPEHWSQDLVDADAWDLKGLAEEIAGRLCGVRLLAVHENNMSELDPLGGPWLSWPRFRAVKNGKTIGVAGRVTPSSVGAPPWAASVFGLEFELEAVERRPPPSYHQTSQYPAIQRDLSVTLPIEVEASSVEEALHDVTSDLLESVRLFDVYEGEELGEGRRALGWAFRFRASDRTLTDQDVESEMLRFSDALEEQFDARIRKS
jgi:phenylalanyl-tRNA synthetase beta chain